MKLYELRGKFAKHLAGGTRESLLGLEYRVSIIERHILTLVSKHYLEVGDKDKKNMQERCGNKIDRKLILVNSSSFEGLKRGNTKMS